MYPTPHYTYMSSGPVSFVILPGMAKVLYAQTPDDEPEQNEPKYNKPRRMISPEKKLSNSSSFVNWGDNGSSYGNYYSGSGSHSCSGEVRSGGGTVSLTPH